MLLFWFPVAIVGVGLLFLGFALLVICLLFESYNGLLPATATIALGTLITTICIVKLVKYLRWKKNAQHVTGRIVKHYDDPQWYINNAPALMLLCEVHEFGVPEEAYVSTYSTFDRNYPIGAYVDLIYADKKFRLNKKVKPYFQ